ncbi:calcium-binding protein [Pseudodesulfovibrio tunisiensis]|uniref:calcium-binding protein n=1 Tax=Pseudodesulfovibrio tunisiensis TaxID=463192 RepID=UPI001FB3280E|nr:calcium-binding protein [Pseudodesulfovibrio tunisiensis]
MKKSIAALFVAALFLGVCSMAIAGTPELRGTWKGMSYLHKKDAGFVEGQVAVVINEQKGQLFAGYKLWFDRKTKEVVREGFSGVLADDGVTLYLADHEAGYTTGLLTGRQTLSLYYVEHGALAKTILQKLERIRFTKAFVEIDSDGDSTIMRTEIFNVYPLNAERILSEADLDKDGKLTSREWEAWKKKNP